MATDFRAIDPKNAVVAFNEAATAIEAGNEKAAVAAWERALDLDPGLVQAALNLITYSQRTSDLHRELSLWERVVGFDPFHTDHLVLQAAALRKAGDRGRAIENYRRAIAIYPYFKFWYHELASLLEETGADDAPVWRRKGDTLAADEAELCYEDGVGHAKASRWSSARSCFEAVLEDFPDNLDARLRLTEVLERCGTPEEVADAFEQALESTDAAKGLVLFRKAQWQLRTSDREGAIGTLERAINSVPIYGKAQRLRWVLQQERAAEHDDGRAHRAEPGPAAPAKDSGATANAVGPAAANGNGASGNGASGFDASAPAAQVRRKRQLLKPDEIGMERVDENWPRATIPRIEPPNRALPWRQQLHQILGQVLSLPAPGGAAPRVAIGVEPDADTAPILEEVLSEIRTAARTIRSDADRSHIFVFLTDRVAEDGSRPAARSGWLGQSGGLLDDVGDWRRGRAGFSLGGCLSAVNRASGPEGFNCLILLGFGRCHREHADPRTLLSNLRTHALCYLHPSYHYVDMRLALGDLAPNTLEIAFEAAA